MQEICSKIIDLNSEKAIARPKLITVGSAAGDGKSIAINTMIIEYLKEGISVLLFSETHNRAVDILFPICAELKNNNKYSNKDIGTIIVFPMLFSESIEYFNDKVKDYIDFLNSNKYVIVIDGDMFSATNIAFSYKNLKNTNTRYVIFEKFNPKPLDYSLVETFDIITRRKQISEALRTLAQAFNTHVVITANHARNAGKKDSLDREIVEVPVLMVSDIYMHVQKENQVFTIKCLKDRMGNMPEQTEYILDKEKLIFKNNTINNK